MEKFSRLKFKNTFGGNLAIFCSDERFVEASLAFCKNSWKINRCDLMVLPGGPAFIANNESNLMKRLKLLIKAHKIRRVTLIAHTDCGYYKKYFGKTSQETIMKQQIADIQKAIQKLNGMAVNISVCGFYSYLDNSKIIFRQI